MVALSVVTTFADDGSAGGLKLGHFFDTHYTHAAGALQRKPGVIAERRHLDTGALAGFNQQSARRDREFLAVDSECYVSHE